MVTIAVTSYPLTGHSEMSSVMLNELTENTALKKSEDVSLLLQSVRELEGGNTNWVRWGGSKSKKSRSAVSCV